MSAHWSHTMPYGAFASIRKGSPSGRCGTWFGKWRPDWVSALAGQLLLGKHNLMVASMDSYLSIVC